MRVGRTVRLALVVVAVISTAAWACNIPVFRYALERWKPDRLRAKLYVQGKLADESQAALDELRRSIADGSGPNLQIEVVDLSDPTQKAELGKQPPWDSENELPFLRVQGSHPQGDFTCWASTWDHDSVKLLLDSPARRKIADRLLRGDAVVWVMVKSDDQEKDRKVRSDLDRQLSELSKKLELPEGIGLPGSELFSEVPLLLRFSVVEIGRDDEDERFLLDLCKGFQPQSFEQNEPVVLPVFGRGRALEVLPAKDLSDELVRDLTLFLCGACSCQVKDQNPGFDLLMNAAWEAELFGDGPQPPSAKAISPQQRTSPELLAIPPGRKR